MVEPGYGRADFGESRKGNLAGPVQSLFELMKQPTGQTERVEIQIYPCPIGEMCLGEWFTVDRHVALRAEALQKSDEDSRASVVTGQNGVNFLSTDSKLLLTGAAVSTGFGGGPAARAAILKGNSDGHAGNAETYLHTYYNLDNVEPAAQPTIESIRPSFQTRVVVTDGMLTSLSKEMDILNQSRIEYLCRDGHEASGALCADCVSPGENHVATDARYVGGTTKLCRTCQDQAVSNNVGELLVIIAVGIFLLVYLPVKVGKLARARRQQAAEAALGSGYVLVGSEGNEKASPQVYFKIVVRMPHTPCATEYCKSPTHTIVRLRQVSHFQVIMQFPVIMSVKFPAAFDEVLQILRILKGDIMGYLDIKCAVALNMYAAFYHFCVCACLSFHLSTDIRIHIMPGITNLRWQCSSFLYSVVH
jgi:hypothetical protein